MTEHANRGKKLERTIKKLFESYESRGIHCQQNHPEQLHDGTLVHKHGFDFQILYQGKFYAFDCKECALNAFPIGKVKLHQVKALLNVQNNGGEAFYLVYFTNLHKLIKFSADLLQTSLIKGAKSISPDIGTQTKINILEIQ